MKFKEDPKKYSIDERGIRYSDDFSFNNLIPLEKEENIPDDFETEYWDKVSGWKLRNWGLANDIYEVDTIEYLRVNDNLLYLELGTSRFSPIEFFINLGQKHKDLTFYIRESCDADMSSHLFIVKNGVLSEVDYETNYSLLTEKENTIYKGLENIIKDIDRNLKIMLKVRLVDLLDIPKEKDRKKLYLKNNFWTEHLDFVIIDADETRTILVVELEDKSHINKTKKEVDKFKDDILFGADIDILRITSIPYDKDKIKDTIENVLKYKLPSYDDVN